MGTNQTEEVIHLIYEPRGFVALKTACGFDCSPGREPFHTLSVTTEDKLVTCPKCNQHVGHREGWVAENVTHKVLRPER